jgi:hypothetical protein
MDEVSLILDLLDTKWNASAILLGPVSGGGNGTITTDHVGKPNFLDIRNLQKNKGVRYDLSSKDVIICFEDSNTNNYNLLYDVRDETFTFTLHIRCIQDERAGIDADYGIDRLRALYLILRHVFESNRNGYTASDNSKFNQLFFGTRSESNDRAKRLFGYKINIEAKRYAQILP